MSKQLDIKYLGGLGCGYRCVFESPWYIKHYALHSDELQKNEKKTSSVVPRTLYHYLTDYIFYVSTKN